MLLPTPMRLSLIVLAVVFAGARAAEACSAVLTPVTTVIARSEAIARVRVLGQVPGGEPPGRVALEVVEVLKGRLGDRVLIVTGRLTAPRAPASRQPPYDQLDCARAGGCGGCFAHDYVPGREYLVLLKGGTPYWAPLAPANEEVSGPAIRGSRGSASSCAAHDARRILWRRLRIQRCGGMTDMTVSGAQPSTTIQHLTAISFDGIVSTTDGPMLVDFWAPWCGPCRAIAPVLDQIASELSGQATIGKVNVDEEPALAGRFGVQSIPMLLFFKNGALAETLVGAVPKAEIVRRLQELRD